MRILLVGNRGIQHALAMRLQQEGHEVNVYPGQQLESYVAVGQAQLRTANYDLIVLGSARYFDDPAILELRQKGVPLFGPDSHAAELESSKWQFKAFAAANDIPTPASQSFTDFDLAVSYIEFRKPPFVIKADGPARGCGVTICQSVVDATNDLSRKLKDTTNPYFCGRVVVEDFVEGFEVAVNVFIDDETFRVLPPTKPHKRRDNGDTGPLVAGMGSVAPIQLNDSFYDELCERVLTPTLQGLRDHGWYFRGCLFINLMVTPEDIVVLEYNCRMGDPAMLVDLLLLEGDLGEVLYATAQNRLSEAQFSVRSGVAVAVTICDPGYPDEPIGVPEIQLSSDQLLQRGDGAGIVIAGASRVELTERLRVNNGVIATAIALRQDFASAKSEAYRIADCLPGLRRRSDIGSSILPPAKYAGTVSPSHQT